MTIKANRKWYKHLTEFVLLHVGYESFRVRGMFINWLKKIKDNTLLMVIFYGN
jgi:hypothetical protein